VLLGFTGSVAAIKAIELTRLILQFAEVKVCVTKAAAHFIDMKELRSLCDVYDDESEWYAWTKKGDTVVHIELRRWADIGLVAPLSANSLAKIATGICDNLLTSVLRAWDFNKSLIGT
jgi:phosphopantothenoylcysteine decarboxylase